MAEGGLEAFIVKEEKPLTLIIPEDRLLRRHSFHEVRRGSAIVENIQYKRRNSSFPETRFRDECEDADELNEKLLHINDIQGRRDPGQRRHSKHRGSHRKHRHSRRQSRADLGRGHHHHHHHHTPKHDRRKSSARIDIFCSPDKSSVSEKVELTPEQKTKKKIMMAVLVVTGFIVVVSVILVAVTLQLSPRIDEMVRKENEDFWKKNTNPSGITIRNGSNPVNIVSTSEIPP